MINSNVYSEVYEILSYMDKKTVMKIPIEILETIKSERNEEYISRIDSEDIFNPNNIDEKTLEILACLDVNYWMDKTKKENLKLKYRKKVQIEEEEKQKNYNANKLFDNSNHISNNENSLTQTKETLFEKILNKLKYIFKS